MNSHRDYFLKHLGIGEIWRLRQAEGKLASQSDSISAAFPSHQTETSESSEVAVLDDSLDGLIKDIAGCGACSLCAEFGKRGDLDLSSQCDLLLVIDWSENENFDPELAHQCLGLANNILRATKDLWPRVKMLPLLQSNVPTSAIQIPLETSVNHCGVFLERLLNLTKPPQLMLFGEHIAAALGLSMTGSSSLTGQSWKGLSVHVMPSMYQLLQRSELKRVVWQQLCQL